jgi:hypothetical protein
MPPVRAPIEPVSLTTSLLGYLSAAAGLAAVFFFVLYWVMQPKVIPNPGMAAHFAPPATRLEPLPRKMDAPELAEEAGRSYAAASAADTSASNSKAEKPPREARAPVRKRPRTVVRRDYQGPANGYAQDWNGGGYRQEWNGGYRPWGGNWF